MILSCPKCSTRFLIDPNALGEGRSVRCGACGHTWFQAREPGDAAYEPPPLTLDDEVTTPLGQEKKPRRRAWPRLVAWFLFIFVIAAILGGGYKYRNEVVRRWPPAAKLYQTLGIPLAHVQLPGLRVPKESIKVERGSEGETPILIISGEIENQAKTPQKVGRMRISLVDADSKVIKSWMFTPKAGTLEPGSKIAFKTSIPNPPATAKSIRFDFPQSE